MRQKAKLLAAAWERYRARVIPPSMPEQQLGECKRAFYAGAHLLLTDVLNFFDPGDEPTEKDLTMVQDLQDELIEFAVSVIQEKE